MQTKEVIWVRRTGKVIEKNNEQAVVLLRRHLACENCGRCGGILGGPDLKDHQVEVTDGYGVEVGQDVVVEVDDRKMMGVSFVLYMLPLLALLLSIFVAMYVLDVVGYAGDTVLPAVGMGALAMGVAFMLIRRWDRRKQGDPSYKPVITGLADASELSEMPEESEGI